MGSLFFTDENDIEYVLADIVCAGDSQCKRIIGTIKRYIKKLYNELPSIYMSMTSEDWIIMLNDEILYSGNTIDQLSEIYINGIN